MEREVYKTPEMEVILFETEDVITTSNTANGFELDPDLF